MGPGEDTQVMTMSGGVEAESGLVGPGGQPWRPRSFRSPRKLPYFGRVVAAILAWLLLVVGLAGLVLPGLQGVLILALSVTMFSLTSSRVHERLRSAFRRWPKGWRRVVRVRRSLERWLVRLD
jgi:hypothetical protein